MVRPPDHLVVAVKAVVYLAAIVVASLLLLADPTSPFVALPVVVGVVLVGHALSRDDLRPVEYAVVGLYVALVVVIALAVATALAAVPVPVAPTTDSVVSVVLSVVLVAVYLGASRGATPGRSAPA